MARPETDSAAPAELSGGRIDRVHARRPPDGVILDVDGSESPTFGAQEGTAWNGHVRCTCYRPLFVFDQSGDLERRMLRPGNVHSAEGWREVLEPVIARYRERGLALPFRGDAAFAKPELSERLEAEGMGCAIRLPANAVLQERIGHLLTRPAGTGARAAGHSRVDGRAPSADTPARKARVTVSLAREAGRTWAWLVSIFSIT
jgi:DDE family transposase